MSQVPNYITPLGLERIQRELAWLQKEERPMIVHEVSVAAAMGDRSENAEYIYGKKRLRSIDSRMRYLMGCLSRVQIVDPAVQSGSRVRFGATVEVEDEQGEQRTWKIFGEHEVDVDAGVISWRSPLARAILGKDEGDAVSFKAPGGLREIELVSVSYEVQGSLPDDWKPRPPPIRG